MINLLVELTKSKKKGNLRRQEQRITLNFLKEDRGQSC